MYVPCFGRHSRHDLKSNNVIIQKQYNNKLLFLNKCALFHCSNNLIFHVVVSCRSQIKLQFCKFDVAKLIQLCAEGTLLLYVRQMLQNNNFDWMFLLTCADFSTSVDCFVHRFSLPDPAPRRNTNCRDQNSFLNPICWVG